jgi:hypothetical protein
VQLAGRFGDPTAAENSTAPTRRATSPIRTRPVGKRPLFAHYRRRARRLCRADPPTLRSGPGIRTSWPAAENCREPRRVAKLLVSMGFDGRRSNAKSSHLCLLRHARHFARKPPIDSRLRNSEAVGLSGSAEDWLQTTRSPGRTSCVQAIASSATSVAARTLTPFRRSPPFPGRRRHMVSRAYRTFRRRISCVRVVIIRAPVAPIGCPSEMPEPLTLSLLQSSHFQAFSTASTWAAKASFTSTRPMSSKVRPDFSKTFATAPTAAKVDE